MTGAQAKQARHMNATDEILGPPLERGQINDVAIEFGDTTITYGELNEQVNKFGNALKPHLARGDRVLLLLKDTPVFVAAFLGVMRIGGVAVPFSTRASVKDLAFVLQDSEALALLIDEEFIPLFHEALATGIKAPPLVAARGNSQQSYQSIDGLIAGSGTTLASEFTGSDDPAFWLYTSGSTGTPKGAVHCHGHIAVGDCYFKAFGYGPGERIFASSKLFFAFALGHSMLAGLRTGSTIILYDGWPDSDAIARIVERHQPTVVLSVPAFYRTLCQEGHASRPAFKTVRCYLSAGESLPESLYRRWFELTGRSIIEGIGMTETLFMIVSGTPAEHHPGATGKPMPYAQTKLVDGDRDVTRPNTPGVLWIKMDSLSREYWRQPEKTNAAFRDGWFCTGDVFVVDGDGWWRHQGRADDLLKISGQWVSPAEIEECAVTVAGVAEAVVVGVPDRDGLVRLAMFLVASEEANEDLKRHVQERLLSELSKYKCPRNIIFVDVVPRTATGKVRRFRLRDWLAADLLRRLISSLNLSFDSLAQASPQIVIDMQKRCAKCESHDRCIHDIESGNTSAFRKYCPNAETLVEMQFAQPSQ